MVKKIVSLLLICFCASMIFPPGGRTELQITPATRLQEKTSLTVNDWIIVFNPLWSPMTQKAKLGTLYGVVGGGGGINLVPQAGGLIIGNLTPAWSVAPYLVPEAACAEGEVWKANALGNFVCSADSDTGSATPINDIADAAGNGTINQTGYQQTFTSTLNSAGAMWTFNNTTNPFSYGVSFFDFVLTANADANGYFMRGYHNNSTLVPVWYIGPGGKFYGSEFESSAADGDRRLQMQANTSRDPVAGEHSLYWDNSGAKLMMSRNGVEAEVADTSGSWLTDAMIPAPTLTVGTARSTATNNEYIVCTGTCTVTPKAPVAGAQVCIRNAPNVSTQITLAGVASVMYEKTDHTGWDTAADSLSSGGSVSDKICLVGYDATHYLILSAEGTWTNN